MEKFTYSTIRKLHNGISGEIGIDLDGETIATVIFYASRNGEIEIGPSGGALHVKHTHRRRGLGKKVSEEALRVAKEASIKNGCRPIKSNVNTADWNIPAQKIAKSLGYKLVSQDYMDNPHEYELIF